MNKTKIEWCDYTINPVKGLCPMACSYCYARRMYKRFKWDTRIRFENWHRDLHKIAILQEPSRIFIGSTIELFGDWVEPRWLKRIFETVKLYQAHTFIFLTKQPQNLIKWSPFPDNCWVGVSATDSQMFVGALYYLKQIEAKIKYISLEPLLERIIMPSHDKLKYQNYFQGINWLIIGSQTQPVRHPPREWVDEIITAAYNANIPVFVKEPMASHFNIHRQEFPLTTPLEVK